MLGNRLSSISILQSSCIFWFIYVYSSLITLFMKIKFSVGDCEESSQDNGYFLGSDGAPGLFSAM